MLSAKLSVDELEVRDGKLVGFNYQSRSNQSI